MLQNEMQLLIPPGTITFSRKKTTIDLVWGNENAANCLLKCQIASKNDHSSDHLPIEIILDIVPQSMPPTNPPYNFSKATWETMQELIKQYLPPLPEQHTLTTEVIDTFAATITDAISRVINETTPRKKPSPFSKCW